MPGAMREPWDAHLHLRDGSGMADVVGFSAAQCRGALVMPNLKPPVTTTAMAIAYRERILNALPRGARFDPRMTLYLTDATTVAEVRAAKASGVVIACKLYPRGATTNSDSGVSDVLRLDAVLGEMEREGLVLCVHGEVTHDPGSGEEVDMFDREARFIADTARPLHRKFPGLRIVLEHVTTEEACDFVAEAGDAVAATVTPQHMLYNRQALFAGGLRPHMFCLPILKRERHRRAVCKAATSGSPKFFMGTDSAPHPRGAKESACGCAGVFSAHAAIELYAMAFEGEGALEHLEAFLAVNGPAFYGLQTPSTRTVQLTRERWIVPASYKFGDDIVVPLGAEAPLELKATLADA